MACFGFGVDAAAFGEVFFGEVCGGVPGGEVEVGGGFLAVVAFVDGEGEVGGFFAAGCGADFGIAGEVADEVARFLRYFLLERR